MITVKLSEAEVKALRQAIVGMKLEREFHPKQFNRHYGKNCPKALSSVYYKMHRASK